MKYIELEDLVIGTEYICTTYDGSENLTLVYVGEGDFEDSEGFYYTVYGEIRYVLEESC